MIKLSLLIFVIWLILNAKVTWEIIIFGILVVAIVMVLANLLTPKMHKHRFPLNKLYKTFVYLLIVVKEVILANIEMIRIVLFVDEKDLSPALTSIKVDIKNPIAITALANSITLTPGTITAAINDEEQIYYIHALDKSMLEEIDDSIFVQKLKELEE